MKDQVVAEFGLGEEQPMLATRFFSLFRSEEGASRASHFDRRSIGPGRLLL
jgi:hypothetical protein